MILIATLAVFASCENNDWEFPDYDYSTVYFSYQYPVRTITLGEDNLVNTDLDNAHKCRIMATLGGVYENKNNVKIDFVVDNSLVDNLTFEDGTAILPMPAEYYNLSSSQIIIPKGSIVGGVEIQLTDAFFADPDAIKNTYVIPVVMTNVAGADSILRGKPKTENADRLKGAADWDVLPKDYILYAVKYINTWHADYLRRGTDMVKENGGTAQTISRRAQYVEKDEVCRLKTISLNALEFPVEYKSKMNTNMEFQLKLDFDAEQNCVISPITNSYQLNDTIRLFNITTSGNGKFVKRGEKKSWGNEDRDALYLDYNINCDVEIKYTKAPVEIQTMEYNTKDTLVVRDRGVVMETFIPVKN